MKKRELDIELPSENALKDYRPYWIDRNADKIINLLSIIFALITGFLLLLGIIFIFNGNDNDSKIRVINISPLAAVFAAIVSLALIFFFIWRQHKFEIYQKEQNEITRNYILSDWSIITLRSAGVPADITSCLRRILNEEKDAAEITKLDKKNAWLAKLKERLGDTRFNEFEPIILKYTLRIEDDRANSAESDR